MPATSRDSSSTASTRRSSSPTPTTSANTSAPWRGRAGDVRWIVVAGEPITDIDATAGETLGALNDELDAEGIELAFRRAQGPGARPPAPLRHPDRDRPASLLPHPGRGRSRLPSATQASTGSTGRITSLPMTRLTTADVDGRPPALVRTLQPMSRGVSPKYDVYSAVVSAVSVTQMLRAASLCGEPSGPFAARAGSLVPLRSAVAYCGICA